ncbi:hypothetical protein BH11MYX2_BH11MYX2_30310 [soil metagenome]
MKAALALLLLAVGCDAKATASDPGSSARPENKSKEYESCGTTAHCADELRCFDNVCVRTERSVVGDYYAAVGRQAMGRGDAEAAATAYKQAEDSYENDKVSLPAAIDCEYGAALAAGRAKKDVAELGARVLHRCVLATPAASGLHHKAMGGLALLGEVGLDPALIAAPQLANAYLTKVPTGPSSDKVAVTVTANPAPAKSMALFEGVVADPATKTSLVACWDAYHKAAKKDAVGVTLTVKSGFYQNPDYDDEGRFIVKVDPAAGIPVGTPDAAADTCVRAVVEPAIKSLKIAENFTTKLTISVK